MRQIVSRLKHLFAATAVAFAGTSAHAEPIYGLTTPAIGAAPSLLVFDSSNPALVTTIGGITGITAGQNLNAIDFRPSDGQLYALSSAGPDAQLYTVDLVTAALTAIGTGFTMAGNETGLVSIDFDPVANALRIVTGSGGSYRVNADTGALIAQDADITAGKVIADIAYSNNGVGATSTTLYDYEFLTDTLGTIGSIGGAPISPDSGQFIDVGITGIAATSLILGFDISSLTGIGYVSLGSRSNTSASEFYTVNLATGALSLVGNFGITPRDFSVAIAPRAVPEPEGLALMMIGLAGIGCAARRSREG